MHQYYIIIIIGGSNTTPVAYRCIAMKYYTRKYRLNKHLSQIHGIDKDECTRNFHCPINYGIRSFRINKELLNHCEEVHDESLGRYSSSSVTLLS